LSAWLAWARNALIAWAALMLFAAAVTQLFAALFGYDTRFGEPAAFWFGYPLYDPWRFLHWGFELAPRHPGIALLCLLLALICMLAAFAVLALVGLLAPADLPHFKSRRGFCSWDKLGQCGLLAANGLALGAVARFARRKPAVLYAPTENVALAGAPRFTDASLIAAASAWPGPLVFVDARGIMSSLRRRDIARFAPGRADSLSLNPLLAIRAGPHAWADARLVARAMLGVPDDATVDAFAVMILDQLINALVDERNLSSLRARLSQPHRVLTEISAAWSEDLCRAPAPHCEIARTVRAWRTHPNAALAHMAMIDDALAFLSNGAYASATSTCQLKFADLSAGQGPRTLVMEFPRGDAGRAAPLMGALLAQPVSACAANADTDHLGRPNKRGLLIVLEAEALKLLAAHDALSSLNARSEGAGCRFLVQAEQLQDVPQAACDVIAAIGPQDEHSAERLSKRGGEFSEWRLLSRDKHSLRAWALPTWARIERAIVSVGDLVKADATQAHIFVQDLPPIRARALCVNGPPATFLNGADLKPIAHDWQASPQIAEAATTFTTTGTQPPQPTPIGANIRAALSRRAPPKSKPKARSS
jgi:type IV secretory pathway TraG/TraD family ATPase VirD4